MKYQHSQALLQYVCSNVDFLTLYVGLHCMSQRCIRLQEFPLEAATTMQHIAAVDHAALFQLSRFLYAWVNGASGVAYTPAGLPWFSQWGTLRDTMNTALTAMLLYFRCPDS